MARKIVAEARHVYGNVFMGDVNAMYAVRTWNNGEPARLRALRATLYLRVVALADAGREAEAQALEDFLYSVRHCGPANG